MKFNWRFFLLSGVFALVAFCRIAAGGEGGTLGSGDPIWSLFRILTDFGALGAFIIYLIWQRKKDSEKREEDSKRWYALDRELIGLVEKCTKAITESTMVMAEIRVNIHENTMEIRRNNSIAAIDKSKFPDE